LTTGTACNVSGQCVPSAGGDSSGCAISDNTRKGNVKCTPAIIAKAQIACIGVAVNTRETTVGTALAAYTTSLNNAYTTRASALQLAYQLTTLKEVQNTVKTTWANFNKSIKLARTTWQSVRSSAWRQYVAAANACKAPSGTGDGGYSSYEVMGN